VGPGPGRSCRLSLLLHGFSHTSRLTTAALSDHITQPAETATQEFSTETYDGRRHDGADRDHKRYGEQDVGPKTRDRRVDQVKADSPFSQTRESQSGRPPSSSLACPSSAQDLQLCHGRHSGPGREASRARLPRRRLSQVQLRHRLALRVPPFRALLFTSSASYYCRQLRTGAKNLPFTLCHFVVNLADLEVFSNALPHTVRSGIKLLHMPLLYMPMYLDTDECRNMLGNLGCFPALETIWVTWVFYADWRVRNPFNHSEGYSGEAGRL
jgi:hypothetical protein